MSRKNIRLGWFGRGNIYDIETGCLFCSKTMQHTFTFNACERLYFISVSSCVSIAYNTIRYQIIYEHFAQYLYMSFIHIDHLHRTIHFYCHSYYIIKYFNVVWLCSEGVCAMFSMWCVFVGSVLGSNHLFTFRGPFIYCFECFL